MNENEMEWNETDSSFRNRVPTNELDSDDEQNTSKDAESIEDKTKQRGKSRPYEKIIQFEDFDFAKKYMEEREDYTYRYIRESHVEGDKLWYTCSNNNKCPKTIYLHMHIDSGLPQLSIPQINSLKARLKIENGQKEKGGFEWRKMLEWCRSHSNIPDDECEVFCVDIDYELLKVKDKDVLKYLRIFISTKRLKNENCKFIEEEEVLSYTESECESEKEEQVKEKKKRGRKRKDVEKNTVRDDDDFDLFKDLPMTSAAANTLSNITHSINNVSLNETQHLNKRAKVDETINKIKENAVRKKSLRRSVRNK